MPTPFLIVDGYNLVHAAGLMRKKPGPGGLERAREKLFARLTADLSEKQRGRTTIVFDAHHSPPGGNREQKHEGMTIVYAEPESDADTVIEELIAEHSAPKQILVVSGDRRLQDAAKRRKGKSVGSERFLKELARRQPERDRAAEAKARMETQLDAAETEAWLAEFGDVKVEDVAAEGLPIGDLVKPDGPAPEKPPGLDEWESLVDEMEDDDWDPSSL